MKWITAAFLKLFFLIKHFLSNYLLFIRGKASFYLPGKSPSSKSRTKKREKSLQNLLEVKKGRTNPYFQKNPSVIESCFGNFLGKS